MSLKGDKYETAEEIKFRLEGSIVQYDGRPVYIVKAGGLADGPMDDDDEGPVAKNDISRVWFQELPSKHGAKSTRKLLSSRKFDLAPFKMGFINYNSRALYLARTAARQNKQGLTAGTLSITDHMGKPFPTDFGGIIRDKAFVDMFDGKYPSFKDAGDLLTAQCKSVAVSRSFCFSIDPDLDILILSNKGNKCGTAYKGDKHIRLSPKFAFLKEELEECRIPIA